MLKKKSESLADKISNILITAPASLDPEEDVNEETSARAIITNLNSEDEGQDDDVLISQFRRKNVDLLEDLDQRYLGKKSSRRDLVHSDDELESSDSQELAVGTSSDSPEDDASGIEDEQADSDNFDSARNTDMENLQKRDKVEENFKHMKESNISSDLKKATCVRNQLNMWEHLLEIRIQLQKCLLTASKMPLPEMFEEIKSESGKEFTSKAVQTKRNVISLLEKLVQLQSIVLNQFPETQKLFRSSSDSKREKNVDGSDEEIPSDTDGEKSGDDSEAPVEEVHRKKRKASDYGQEITKRHEKYTDYRNSVIQKWHDKTKIAAGKNTEASHSVVNHIYHILTDKAKLIRRTQLNRSCCGILGETTKDEENAEPGTPEADEDYNANIFDDSDFYHQLLRELIEHKSQDLTDPTQLGRQWLELQNLRSKMKRKTDTKATKGRKIRYTVHPKLVNFMAPIEENSWTDEAISELFGSLFGKTK